MARFAADDGVLELVFEVEELEDTRNGRLDVLLRLAGAGQRPDATLASRAPYDAAGTAAVVEASALAPDATPADVRIAEVARGGVAFLADRRNETGETLDIAFPDEAGALVRFRARIVQEERAVYGRTRYVVWIAAIGELDAQRLERLCSRAGLRAAGVTGTVEARPLRDLLAPDTGGSALRRLFRRD